ncbi:TIGR02444 family protein [Pseudolabrys taiwanensis]|uniref:TIGR02444 family protein n=1 Tax=Pseudolabrys taiwanensis TaxID=331696 RepID=UPI0013B39356|nr:TIGR02444 family protein [Pseudolabrys taiwanensis]
MLDCDNAFWRFSLAVYAQPGVGAECLALQGALDIDVNVLLFCAWLGAERKLVLGDEALAAIDAGVLGWHESVVRPLRAVRQTMKPMPEMADEAVKALRKEVAAVELRAEQIEQARLFEMADTVAHGATVEVGDAVEANVAAFLRRHAKGAESPSPPRLLIAAAAAYRPDPQRL